MNRLDIFNLQSVQFIGATGAQLSLNLAKHYILLLFPRITWELDLALQQYKLDQLRI